ncbi:hypothetical protein HNQ51_001215 [Inhella inkyongensis]|uniref:DUF1272 domain-containing protein n=1 Tax=Inhella inkyongensis TaxID=392593 RepID=A0A840S310_9BURK|nr:DUF1272 domain-containing protein [Inhella inkyongensis]MBB5203922.1 hypothetical protein [Inhella inkyongensis]
MKPICERCQVSLPAEQPGAWICSYECSFCSTCCVQMGQRCPNCGGDLQRRPTRQPEQSTDTQR